MNRKTLLTAAVAAAFTAFTGCSSSRNSGSYGAADYDESAAGDVVDSVAACGYSSFAWTLYDKTAAAAEGKNMLVSPLGMAYCLGMVGNGAAGATSDEIISALGLGETTDEVNRYCRYMMKRLPKLDTKTTLSIANCVEINSQYTLQNDFKTAVKDSYSALVESKDFAAAGFADYLNSWCSRKTGGMIPKLIDDVPSDAVAYIMNALYFKGVWAEQFDEDDTYKEPFHTSSGRELQLDMMHNTADYGYAQTATYQLLSMDYGNGAYSMQVVLPAKGKSLADVATELAGKRWLDVLKSVGNEEVGVALPKFSIEYGGVMNEVLKSLGIKQMFDRKNADLSRLCDADVCISRVIQRAKIDVDEHGTKAAAATAAEVVLKASLYDDKKWFTADRPFIFVITEKSTGTALFLGQYTGE